jgi:hypothetical protein
VESSCEFGNEPTGSMKCWETFEWPSISCLSSSVQLHIVSYLCILKNMNERELYNEKACWMISVAKPLFQAHLLPVTLSRSCVIVSVIGHKQFIVERWGNCFLHRFPK